ncbi:hypothetical protein A9Q98_11090 [Thalassotalea sp. 42_200_T64]|nr:hypothetical protein A9Q98_11090 [Thalassotalea sp. 42_200_T64]
MNHLISSNQKTVGLWAVALLMTTAFSFSTVAKDAKTTVVKTLSNAQQIELLTKKFKKGKYSKKGADSCLKCHDGESDRDGTQIFVGRHGALADASGPMGQLQCESCHGPVGKHDKRPRKGKQREPMLSFDKNSALNAEQKNSVCLTCHDNDHTRMGWLGSEHESNDIACVDCHILHVEKDPILSKVQQNDVCTSCHTKQKIELHKRSSHPLKFDRQVCTDCHNPHDSTNDASLKADSINENCLSCHSEKQGPKLWEHEPVIEDCSICHAPHGANNAMLLKKRVPQLCQECHSSVGHSSAAYVNANGNKVQGKSCLNCHSKIHGSNSPDGNLFQH